MNPANRRQFLQQTLATAAVAGISPYASAFAPGQERAPNVHFPSAPRARLAIASYPFREFIQGKHDAALAGQNKMPLKDFSAHVREKFGIAKIEPWSEHLLSLEPAYLEEIRAAVAKAGGAIINIAADGEHSPYAPAQEEREQAISFSKSWIDAAVRLGSPGVRTNIPAARGAKLNAAVLSESLKRVADYGARKNIVVHLENDNPVSEDPFFLVRVIERVDSPWLRALPDFGNSVGAMPAADAYRAIDAMFAHAYGISHVKNASVSRDGKIISVDLARTFSIAAKHRYKGYFSMEWDSPGDPYAGTRELIESALKNLAAEKEEAAHGGNLR